MDYDFRYKQSHVSLMAEDLVRMVTNTGSLLTFQGTEGNAVFSALRQALTHHEGDSFMAVINHGTPHSSDSNNDHAKTCCSLLIQGKKFNLQPTESDGYQDKPCCFCFKSENKDSSNENLKVKKREALSKTIVESHKWMEKCITCENIIDICSPEDVCECTVVINGDIQQIKTVIKKSVAKKRPVILVKGLGKVMDDLAVLVQKKKSGKDKDVVGDDDLKKFVEELSKKMELLHVYDVDYDRSAGKNTLPSASKNADSDSESIEGKILSALAKRFEKEIKSRDEEHRKLLLEMCIECDEFDVAECGGLLPEKGDVLEKETLVKALDWGQEKFVHHFLNPRLNFGTDKQITEEDVDTLYEGSLKKRVNELIPTVYLHSQEGKNQENTNMLDGEDLTRRNIFIYAVLTGEYKLAKVMLGHVHQHTPAALLACGLLKAKARKTDKYRNKHQVYKEKSREFGQLAENSILRGYEKFPIRTFHFLLRRMEAWGNVSLMYLARDTMNKYFLMLEPCYCLQETVWVYGDNAIYVLKDKTKDKTEINRIENIILKSKSPRKMCRLNLIGLILFLIAFACLIISKLEMGNFHFLEWIVLAAVITFFLQEWEQLLMEFMDHEKLLMEFKDREKLCDEVENKWKKICTFFTVLVGTFWKYICDYFNFIDFTSVLFYVVAFGLRVDAYYKPGDTDRMDAARAFFGISFAFFMLRLLRFCYINKSLAPMVLMIIRMFKILRKFLVILAIFVVAYAVASQAVLYPESKLSWALVFHVLRKPYWSMYGELFLDELEADGSDHCTVCTTDPNLYETYDELRCASKTGRYIVPVFQGIYVLIVNILLFNLLIALFSSAVQKVETKSKELWSFQRSVILREFSRYMLPLPYTTILSLFRVWCPRKSRDPFSYAKESLLHEDEVNGMERQTRHDQEEEDKRESQLHLMGIAKTVNNEKIQIHLPHLNCMSPRSSTSTAQEVKPTKSGDEPLGDHAELPRPQSSTSGKKTRQKSKQRRHGYPEGGRGPRETFWPGGHPIFDNVDQDGYQP